MLTAEDVARITSLDDLIDFFDVDLEAWQVRDFRVNKWEQHSVANGIVPLYQVRANLVRNVERDREIAAETLRELFEDIRVHAPPYLRARPAPSEATAEPVMVELALMDPHLGMLAWEPETGNSYDLERGTRDYRRAVEHLLRTATLYPNVEKILLVVGNDTLHVDSLQDGKVGATTAGTPQDFDSRLPKIFSEARRAIVDAVDMALEIAPVDVVVVPGNHDEHSMYKLGEVLSAWYRNCDRVTVDNRPTLRKYYTYGGNLIGLTHGKEFRRKRDNLALIMLDEAPRQGLDLREYVCREWHTGHYHATAERVYMSPAEDLTEIRGIRCRSLPGLTGHDAWHVSEGYHHLRASTALVYRRSGGFVGLQEFHP